ncbi:MAG: BlaI/MecI/CopY family transcriptional regulator [Oscillospiraceae bacterium]|nr:BlaI/MecI/CopY family transcriptional regulator [Oscillospiraceae bacterium]
MSKFTLGAVEARFADIVWDNAPITSGELVRICERELDWKKPTTYTVLRKLCQKGLFRNDNCTVTAVLSRDDFHAAQSEQFVSDTYNGSLPAFVAAFLSRKPLSDNEAAEIRRMIDEARKGDS